MLPIRWWFDGILFNLDLWLILHLSLSLPPPRSPSPLSAAHLQTNYIYVTYCTISIQNYSISLMAFRENDKVTLTLIKSEIHHSKSFVSSWIIRLKCVVLLVRPTATSVLHIYESNFADSISSNYCQTNETICNVRYFHHCVLYACVYSIRMNWVSITRFQLCGYFIQIFYFIGRQCLNCLNCLNILWFTVWIAPVKLCFLFDYHFFFDLTHTIKICCRYQIRNNNEYLQQNGEAIAWCDKYIVAW